MSSRTHELTNRTQINLKLSSVTHQPTTSLHFHSWLILLLTHGSASWRLTHNWMQTKLSPRWFSVYNLWSDMQESTVASLLLLTSRVAGMWRHCGTRRLRDPSPLLPSPNVYSCRLATGNVFTSALRSDVRGATRHGTSEICTARRKQRFAYCWVIAMFTEVLPITSMNKSVTILKLFAVV
jgi:hypothetical protein